MLVLSRKVHESIVIGPDIIVTVLEVSSSGKQIRIGITAPKDLPVHRQEIWLKIQEAKERSA